MICSPDCKKNNSPSGHKNLQCQEYINFIDKSTSARYNKFADLSVDGADFAETVGCGTKMNPKSFTYV